MGLSKATVDALIGEYKVALLLEDELEEKDVKLATEVDVLVNEMRANKKQITSLRAILKSNAVDVKALFKS
jgi:hypothetical protein